MSGSDAGRRLAHRRFADRVRFTLERLVLRGLGYRLLLAAGIVLVVALVSGGIAVLLDAGFDDLSEAVWWAFLRLTDPGYLGDDEGVARRTVSTVVTVLGYVLFLGLLIAILTQWLNQTIGKLESGTTPVALRDHVIILGWSHRTPTIVTELLSTRGRVRRFLAGRSARDLRIVILADHVDAALVQELRDRLGTLWNDRQVLVRSGSPLRVDHLERVAFRDAAVLILPGAGFAEPDPEAVDVQTVKTLLSVSTHARAAGAEPPLAVSELYDSRNADVARQAYRGDNELIATDEIISRVIAKSVLQRGLCGVFTELLTLGGNALYLRTFDDPAGARFGDLRDRARRAIPLGVMRPGAPAPVLNPDPELRVEADDLLVFIARSFDDCALDETPAEPVPASAASDAKPLLELRRRVLILGWGRKAPRLLRELERYGRDTFHVDVVSAIPAKEREQTLARDIPGPPSSRVRHIEANVTLPGVMEGLDPASYDAILLLASERLEEEAQADASTIFRYVMLHGLLPSEGARPKLFVELLDEENEFLFSKERDDVIVSPMLASYLLSQVSLRRELAAVFAKLSRPRGPQLVLQPASRYVDADRPVRFDELQRAAAARREIAIGVRRDGRADGLTLNPDRSTEWTLEANDRVVALATFEPGPEA